MHTDKARTRVVTEGGGKPWRGRGGRERKERGGRREGERRW